MRVRDSSVAAVLSGLALGLWVLGACAATRGWCSAAAPATPSVDELLSRYSQTMDKCLHSFAVKSCSTTDTNWKQSPGSLMPPGPDVLHTRDDFRYDGQRTRDISSRWGSIGVHGPTPENNPILRSEITDFEFSALYSGQRGQGGLIKYDQGPLDPEKVKRTLALGWSHACSFGFFPFHERIDSYLRRSGKATVRRQTEAVNGSACYVIDARTPEGQLVVWLDPAHGYNIARITVTQRAGDRADDQVLPRGHEVARVFTNTSFQQIDGTWIPTTYATHTRIYRPGFMVMEGGTRSEVSEFLIDPNHTALKSFDVNDFPEGTRTSYMDNGRLLPTWYIWKNGGPVPDTSKTPDRSR
jgi:hypothetical protein